MSNETAEAVETEVETPEVVAGPTDDAGTDTPETEPKEPAKPEHPGFQKRIDELVGQRYALQEDRDYWRNKALELEKTPTQETAPEPPTRPKLEDFDHDVEKYAEALADYTDQSIAFAADSKVKELQDEAQSQSEKAQEDKRNQDRQTAFQQRSQEFAATHPDFYTVISNPTVPITAEMTNVMMEMENGPEVAYYLAQNPEIAFKISQKSPVQIAVDLGRLNTSPKEPPPTSSAPEPPSPVNTGSATPTKLDPRDPKSDKAGTEEWARERLKQLRKQNG